MHPLNDLDFKGELYPYLKPLTEVRQVALFSENRLVNKIRLSKDDTSSRKRLAKLAKQLFTDSLVLAFVTFISSLGLFSFRRKLEKRTRNRTRGNKVGRRREISRIKDGKKEGSSRFIE